MIRMSSFRFVFITQLIRSVFLSASRRCEEERRSNLVHKCYHQSDGLDCFVPRSDAKRVHFSDAKITRKTFCQEAWGPSQADVPTFLECPYWFRLIINKVKREAKGRCPYFFGQCFSILTVFSERNSPLFEVYCKFTVNFEYKDVFSTFFLVLQLQFIYLAQSMSFYDFLFQPHLIKASPVTSALPGV